MAQDNGLPGTFPTAQTKTFIKAKQRLGLKSRVDKLKTYFHGNEHKVNVKKHSKLSKWSMPWAKNTSQVHTTNTVAVGTVFSLNVPITISNTTHYSSKSEGPATTEYTSVVQQLVILPPIQIYGFMFLIALLLFVFAFALLQVHRTISIIELAVDGLKYTLVNLINILSVIKSWV